MSHYGLGESDYLTEMLPPILSGKSLREVKEVREVDARFAQLLSMLQDLGLLGGLHASASGRATTLNKAPVALKTCFPLFPCPTSAVQPLQTWAAASASPQQRRERERERWISLWPSATVAVRADARDALYIHTAVSPISTYILVPCLHTHIHISLTAVLRQ